MKALLLRSLLLLTIPLNAMAQSVDDLHPTELYAGYGILTAQDILTGFSSSLAAGLLPGYIKRIDATGFGTAFAGFDYFVSRRVSLGLQLNYAQYDENYQLSTNTNTVLKTSYLTPLVRTKLAWIRKPGFSFYTSLTAGASFIRSKNVSTIEQVERTIGFAFHVSPIGIRVGNTIGVFAELGFGFQGLVSAGLSIRP